MKFCWIVLQVNVRRLTVSDFLCDVACAESSARRSLLHLQFIVTISAYTVSDHLYSL